MEVYTLNDQFLRVDLIDRFESLIWTDRWNSFGDFELVIHSNPNTRSMLKRGVRLGCNKSRRVMTIENVKDNDDQEGMSLLTLSGRSIESILEDRVAMDAIYTPPPSEGTHKWVLTGTPGEIARYLFKYICVDGTLSTADKIPFLETGSLYQPGTIAEYDQSITIEIERPVSLYAILVDICQAYGLGFRLFKGPDTGKLYFEVYSGNDNTAQQSTRIPVVFSPQFENIHNIAELSSIENYKNTAYVFGKNGSRMVYAPNTESTISGFDRRVVIVDASDVDLPSGSALQTILEQRGQEELSKYKPFFALDGEISQNTGYRYDQLLRLSSTPDYNLGDLVEMRTKDDVTEQMRVTEQIFVDDIQGERAYPTLRNELFITPGSWLNYNPTQVWETVPDGQFWGTLP